MKYSIIISFLIILILVGCFSDKKGNKAEEDSLAIENPSELNLTKVDKLEDYVLALDSSDINSAQKAVLKFKDLFDKNDTLSNDKGVSVILSFFERLSMYANESVFKENVDYFPLIDIEFQDTNKIPEGLESDYKTINQNGFRVKQTEGMYYLTINPIFFQEQFYPYVSSNFEVFLQQLARENEEGYASDAAITIPFQSLVQRTIWWEGFAKDIEGTPAAIRAKKEYQKYFKDLTIGMDNTPAIESQQISPYFREAYNYLKEFAPQSETYQKLQPYIELLEQQKIEEAKVLLSELINTKSN